MNQIATTGVVLSRTNFGEADRILTVLTPDYGKVRLLAKGVRKIKSKLAGGVELFSVSQLTYIVGRGDMHTLVSSRLKTHFGQIVKALDRTTFAYEMLKLFNKITEDGAGEDYFMLLVRTLDAIDDPLVEVELIRLWLQLHILNLSGNGLNLQYDSAGQKLQADVTYAFDFEAVALTPSTVGRITADHIKLLRVASSLGSPKQLQSVEHVQNLLPVCSQVVTTMFRQHIRI